MKKTVAFFVVAAMLLAALAGCAAPSGQSPEGTATQAESKPPVQQQQSTTPSEDSAPDSAPSGRDYTVGVVIKIAGNPFYVATDMGFAEAGEELGINFITNGPSEATVEGQVQIIEGFINQKVDGIAIATNDFDAVGPALQKAMNAGIKVISWDSAVNPNSRAVHVNQADTFEIGASQVRGIAKTLNNEGEIAIVSAGATMSNQNAWNDASKKELEDPKYANMKLVDIVFGDDESEKSYNETLGLIKTYPNLKGIISPTTVGCAAVSKAIADAGKTGEIFVTGIGLPSLQAEYIKSGVNDTVYIWNPIDLGYLSAYTMKSLLNGEITGAAGETFDGGRLGKYTIIEDGSGTQVILGPPLELSKDNIDNFKDIF